MVAVVDVLVDVHRPSKESRRIITYYTLLREAYKKNTAYLLARDGTCRSRGARGDGATETSQEVDS